MLSAGVLTALLTLGSNVEIEYRAPAECPPEAELIELVDDSLVQGDIVAPMIDIAYRARLSGNMRYS